MDFQELNKLVNMNVHLDQDFGEPMFAQKLAYISNKVLEEPLEPLNYQLCATVVSEIPIGATSYSWFETTSYGLAIWVSDYTTEAPFAEVGAIEHTYKPHMCESKYGYNFFEARSAVYAGADLTTRKAGAARDAINRLRNKAFFEGVPELGLLSFFNLSGVPVATIPDNGATTPSTKWQDKTADQIILDLELIKNTPYITTKGIESIDTIAVDYYAMSTLKTKRMGENLTETVYTFWTTNNPGIRIIEIPECKNAYNGDTDVIVGWKNNRNYITVDIPEQYMEMPPERKGATYSVSAYGSYAGIQLFRPLSMVYGRGI